jgi:hypothetical protein
VLMETPSVKLQSPHPPTPKESESDIPPPPPEDELDASFFEDNAIMPMDSVRSMKSLQALFIVVQIANLLIFRWMRWT